MNELDYPPVFHSLKEMEAYDAGDEHDHVCALCGDSIEDLSRQVIGRDDDGNLVGMEVCENCFWDEVYDDNICTQCGAMGGTEQHILGTGGDGQTVALCKTCYKGEMEALYEDINQ